MGALGPYGRLEMVLRMSFALEHSRECFRVEAGESAGLQRAAQHAHLYPRGEQGRGAGRSSWALVATAGHLVNDLGLGPGWGWGPPPGAEFPEPAGGGLGVPLVSGSSAVGPGLSFGFPTGFLSSPPVWSFCR